MTLEKQPESNMPALSTIVIEGIVMGAVKDHHFAPVLDVIEGKKSIYQAEKVYDLPKNTLSRPVAKVRKRISAYEEWSQSPSKDSVFKRL